jgi:hypothetical protein
MTQDVHKSPSSEILAGVAASLAASDDKASNNKNGGGSFKKEQQAIKNTTSNITRLANSSNSEDENVSDTNQKHSFSATMRIQQDALKNKAQESLGQMKNVLNSLQEASTDATDSLEKVCTTHFANARHIQETFLNAFKEASHLTLDTTEEILKTKSISDVMALQMKLMKELPAIYSAAAKSMSACCAESLKQHREETNSLFSKATGRIRSLKN